MSKLEALLAGLLEARRHDDASGELLIAHAAAKRDADLLNTAHLMVALPSLMSRSGLLEATLDTMGMLEWSQYLRMSKLYNLENIPRASCVADVPPERRERFFAEVETLLGNGAVHISSLSDPRCGGEVIRSWVARGNISSIKRILESLRFDGVIGSA